MAKKSKWKGAALSLLGSIPFVGKVKKKAKAVKKAATKIKNKVKTAKKKVVASLKKTKKKIKKKIKKKKGKVVTTARKLKNNLKKKDLVNKFKKIMKKEVLSAKAKLKEISKPVTKSLNSIKEIGTDILEGSETRAKKALDSPYDFANFMTEGGVDAVVSFWKGNKERTEKSTDSVYDFTNYLTLGAVETFKGAVHSDEPLSKEHWLNSIGVAGIIVGGTRVAIPKNGNINKNKTKPSQKIENKANKSNINKSKLPEGKDEVGKVANEAKKQSVTPLENGPYIKNGKPNGRPTLSGDKKLQFERDVYNSQVDPDGLLRDPNTGEVINWKPGEQRKGKVDFGHKTGNSYKVMFEKYKNREITLDELKEFQFNPDNFRLETPSANRSHEYE